MERQLRVEESSLKRKEQRDKRKMRARDLLMIGLLMEKAGIMHYEKEIILGHLLEFKKMNKLEWETLRAKGSELFKRKNEIDDFLDLDFSERKKKAHHLISIGALAEISEVHKEDKALLLGYFNNLTTLDIYILNRHFQEGSIEFMRRRDSGQ